MRYGELLAERDEAVRLREEWAKEIDPLRERNALLETENAALRQRVAELEASLGALRGAESVRRARFALRSVIEAAKKELSTLERASDGKAASEAT